MINHNHGEDVLLLLFINEVAKKAMKIYYYFKSTNIIVVEKETFTWQHTFIL